MLTARASGRARSAGVAGAQDWPDVFDPSTLLSLNMSMDDGDWNTIQNDETFDIEVPAMFWADGETPILVSVRRKSADPLQNGTGFSKVSLKIDINEFVDGQLWHGLNAVPLENGDDIDVVAEGFAWFMHRSESGPEGYDLPVPAAMANWATLTINGVYTGVYVHPEQRDKQFLRNRGLWVSDETWMYEVEDVSGPPELKEGDGDSPTYLHLCYRCFREDCATPPPKVLATELPQYLEMQTLLTMGAVTSFCADLPALTEHPGSDLELDLVGVAVGRGDADHAHEIEDLAPVAHVVLVAGGGAGWAAVGGPVDEPGIWGFRPGGFRRG